MMWVMLAILAVAGATSPVKKQCPDYSPPIIPVDCGKNAYWETCPSQCPPHQNCSLLWSKFPCETTDDYCCEPACRCKSGFYRSDSYKCISSKQCTSNPPEETTPCPEEVTPKPKPHPVPRPKPNPKKCKPNEKWYTCKPCPPRNCDISYTSYSCTKECVGRCDCIDGYFRLKNGNCAKDGYCAPPGNEPEEVTPCPNEDPPKPKPVPRPKPNPKKCKPNEKWYTCKPCPPRNCDMSYTSYSCTKECVGGCDCIDGYFRLKNGICAKDGYCSPPSVEPPIEEPKEPQCGYNEVHVTCPQTCPPKDCEALYFDYLCAVDYSVPCVSGCDCKPNHLRNASKICVPVEDCPPGPWIKPKVINPAEEPKEPPKCRANETYVNCNARCGPYDTCPVDDSRAIIACSQPYPCPPGCACQRGYKRKSPHDDSCILAEDCTPVECTRLHEVWSPCSSGCRAEYCSEIDNLPAMCNELVRSCQPKCICADGYYRNENDDCVPEVECKNCGENKTIVFCTYKCPYHTCPDSDDLTKYACKPPRDCPSGCGCKDGYRFISKDDENCVLAQDCPKIPCTRENEKWDPCPCHSDACEDQNQKESGSCDNEGICDPKCVCIEDHCRNSDGLCVPDCG